MRPSRDEVYLNVAADIAKRSTCFRRSVGCVLTDQEGVILSTGYNGVAAGRPHCNEEGEIVHYQHPTKPLGVIMNSVPSYPQRCEGSDAPSGQNLDACQAIHAEQNAIIRLPDYRRVYTCYCTASPCISCVKLLLGTYCLEIVFREEYPHPTAKEWWLASGREWKHLK
jgi:dCMP deaminase